MWLKNVWQVAGFAQEVGEGLLARRLLNQAIVFYRDAAGAVVAMNDRCPHRMVPLSLGRRTEEGTIECGYHGLRFDSTGGCVFAPGQAAPRGIKVGTYPVVERHKLLWIWLGDAELADPALVPDIYWFDDPKWTVATGYHHFSADYRLLTDNLLDLSHETYVHQRTIGQGAIAESEPSVVARDGAVRALRSMLNIDPPPFFQLFMDYKGRIDRTQLAFFTPPGINMTEYTGKRVEGDQRIFLNRVMHLLTPETEHSTHYFWGQARNYRIDDQELSDTIAEATARTFDEDKEMLEMQQQVLIEQNATVPQAAIRFDIAPVQGQRMLAALVEKERQDPAFVSPPVHIAD
jgi:vanillate O-demethylase monooxygenase subunit